MICGLLEREKARRAQENRTAAPSCANEATASEEQAPMEAEMEKTRRLAKDAKELKQKDAEPKEETRKESPAEETAREVEDLAGFSGENAEAEPRPHLSGPARASRAYAPAPEKPTRFVRTVGGGEPVDTLPVLCWPEGTEDERLNFALRTPFSPFDAPAWRFVRVPSPLPEAANCAVGYRAENDRVAEIAYAIPGRPDRPPLTLPGYHYRPGSRGEGYWVASRWT